MKEISIGVLDAGQRLDKFLIRYFKEADTGFLYRMLRKKNILLNGGRAAGSERLNEGDMLKIFFSDETFDKMRGQGAVKRSIPAVAAGPLRVLYEDDHILAIDKPAGLLTQKASQEEESLNERISAYLAGRDGAGSTGFHPAAAQRLDRNTSGLVLAGKTLPGQQLLSFLLKERRLEKYYGCLVKGSLKEALYSRLFWRKDETNNQVFISREAGEGRASVELKIWPRQELAEGISLLEVELISGKSHQIRAQLAHLGLPLLGDNKYGNEAFNRRLAKVLEMPLRFQLLHSRRCVFPPAIGADALSTTALSAWENLAGKSITAPWPPYFNRVIESLGGDCGK